MSAGLSLEEARVVGKRRHDLELLRADIRRARAVLDAANAACRAAEEALFALETRHAEIAK